MDNFNGVYDIHTNVMQWPAHMQPTHARWEIVDDRSENQGPEKDGRLPHLDPVYGRNFRIHDLCLESTSESWLRKAAFDDENTGLSSIPQEVLDELPADALFAFSAAKSREQHWANKWSTEHVDGLRARMLPSVEWFPK